MHDLRLCTVGQRDDLRLSDVAGVDLYDGHAAVGVADRLQHRVLLPHLRHRRRRLQTRRNTSLAAS